MRSSRPDSSHGEGPHDFGRGGLRPSLLLATVWLVAGTPITAARVMPQLVPQHLEYAGIAPFAVVPYGLGLLGFLVLAVRRPRSLAVLGAVLAAAGLATHLVWALPAYVGSHAAGPANLTVADLNMRLGEADPAETVRLVRDNRADILVATEISTAALAGLTAAGLGQVLSHHEGLPGEGRTGLMVFSRYPMSHFSVLAGATAAFQVRVQAPTPFTLVALHAAQPTLHQASWKKDQAVVGAALRAIDGPRMAVGDFNATVDHEPMRQILTGGMRDAAEEANSGWQPTWPGVEGPPIARIFGLVAIDHVLVSRQFGVVDTHTAKINGSDHRALVAGLVAPTHP